MELINISRNTNMSMRKLSEVNVNRILTKHAREEGFIMISACKGDYIEEGKPELNKMATSALLDAIKASGFSYVPVYGGYHEMSSGKESTETSFIVFNMIPSEDTPGYKPGDEGSMKELIDLGVDWCSEDWVGDETVPQDSVLVQCPNEAPYYVNSTGDKITDDWATFDKDATINDMAKEFYTDLTKAGSNTGYNDKTGKFGKTPKRWTYTPKMNESLQHHMELFINPGVSSSFDFQRRLLGCHEFIV